MPSINKQIFIVDTSVAAPHDFQILRGESVEVECRFRNYKDTISLTGMTATAYWRDPDTMEEMEWYSEAATVSNDKVTWAWTDSNDSHAHRYEWYIKVSGSGNVSYRAFGGIEMIGSPASDPTDVPVADSDYYTKEETDSAIASAIDAAEEHLVPDTREINGHALSADVTLTASDVGAATAAQGAKADRAVLYRTDVTTAVDIGTRNAGTTVGAYSVVEGVGSTATGFSAHAEGASTASGPYSHAEGSSTTAAGYYSHAEGSRTTAAGSHAHSEGENTSATGYASHAEGFYTEAKNHSEHAQGYCNLSHTGNTDAGKTIHSIGVGATIFGRSNAVEVMRDGKVFIKGVGDYDGTNPTGSGVNDLATELNSKATEEEMNRKMGKVPGATVDDFASFNSSGGVKDSGKKAGDFEPTHDYTYFTFQNGTVKAYDFSGTITLQTLKDAGLRNNSNGGWVDQPVKIRIGNKVTGIDASTMDFASELQELDLGEGLQTIGYMAFFNDYKIKGVTFPRSITAIGQYAFSNCNGIRYAEFEGKTLEQIQAMANYGDWGLVVPFTFASQTWSEATFVPKTRTINSKALTSNVTLTASDVGAATEDWVLDQITQGTAIYRGSYATKAALNAVQWQTSNPSGANYVSNNDYAVVQADESQDGGCWRYIYVLDTAQSISRWEAQYEINESPLSQAQLDALNSGATAAKITTIDSKVPNTRTINGKALSSDVTLTASDVGAATTSDLQNYLPLSGGTVDRLAVDSADFSVRNLISVDTLNDGDISNLVIGSDNQVNNSGAVPNRLAPIVIGNDNTTYPHYGTLQVPNIVIGNNSLAEVEGIVIGGDTGKRWEYDIAPDLDLSDNESASTTFINPTRHNIGLNSLTFVDENGDPVTSFGNDRISIYMTTGVSLHFIWSLPNSEWGRIVSIIVGGRVRQVWRRAEEADGIIVQGAAATYARTSDTPMKLVFVEDTINSVGHSAASDYCIAIGNDAMAGAYITSGTLYQVRFAGALAVGNGAIAKDEGTIAIGTNSLIQGAGSIGIGLNAYTTASGAIQLGTGTNATPYSLQVGNTQVIASASTTEWSTPQLNESLLPSDLVRTSDLSGYAQTSAIPTAVSQLTNDTGYITSSALPTSETWTFTLEDGTTVTKSVAVY